MPTFIIAEAGVNHNGELDLAHRLISAALEAGADAVKFQTFRSEMLVTGTAQMADYQLRNTGQLQNQYQMLKRLELRPEDYRELKQACEQEGIQFLSTPFDGPSLDFLVNDLGLEIIKFSSGDLTNGPLLLAAARRGAKVILSTGMATLAEVEQALAVLAFGYLHSAKIPQHSSLLESYGSEQGQQALVKNVSLLQCTTEYPAAPESANLRAMDTLHQAFGLPVGFSDHTDGIAVPIAAVARGARIIEKHFTLDRGMQGPDHKASLEPEQLCAMVEGIRQAEAALGDGIKRPHPSELANIKVARKSLVAAASVTAGETWTEFNLTVKRPGSGVSPQAFWDYLGTPASRDYEADELV